MLVLSLIIMITTRRYICWKMIVLALFWTKNVSPAMTASAWKTTWLQAGQTTSSPISLFQDLYFSRFQDFKVSRESSSTEDRATDLRELSTRTDLGSADLEILTASQDFPADSALQHKCFDHQQWCIWLYALHFAQVHQLCSSRSALMTNRVSH